MKSYACNPDFEDCVRVGKWEFSLGLGYGVRSNPIIENNNVPIYLLPGINYYGERFFWATDTMGFTLFDTQRHMVNVIGTISYDQTFFNNWGVGSFSIDDSGNNVGGSRVESNFQVAVARDDSETVDDVDCGSGTGNGQSCSPSPQEGAIDLDSLHDRNLVGLMGFEYSYDFDHFRLGLQLLQDVTKVHHGKQVRLALSLPLLDAPNATMLFLGSEWKDSKTLDYFYGVREDEVESSVHAYNVGSDLSYYVKLGWRRPISKKWDLRCVVHYRYLGDKVYDSPLVEERGTSTFFLGGVYHF